MTTQVLGLDIGGANLKAAHIGGIARTVAFPLWKQPERLTAELQSTIRAMPEHAVLAVTMTGELCDCFATGCAGVRAILQSVRAAAGSMPIFVWCTSGQFLSFDEAMEAPLRVAAANWLAEAYLLAQQFCDERVLLIDTGSTTTDIAYLNRAVPEPRARTDVERLATGELVYTGMRRTPICAVLGMSVAAEFFATMMDAYLLLGHLPENVDDCDSADGQPMTRARAHARIARLRCADVECFSEADARDLAEQAVRVQQSAVLAACRRVLADRPPVERVIVAGSGEVLGRHVAQQLDRRATSLADTFGTGLSEAACAYAAAVLLAQEQSDGR